MKFSIGILVFFMMGWAAGAWATDTAAADWRLLPAKSSLVFIFGQAGTDEKGQFHSFPSQLKFGADALEQSGFDVKVDMKSVDTGDKDRDEILLSKDMFDVKQWPQAHFKTFKIEKHGENEYQADAELTIRDQTRPLPFPFRLVISEEQGKQVFRLQSEVTFNRLDFGVGQGEWKATTWIPDPVKVIVDIQAERASVAAAPPDNPSSTQSSAAAVK
ncbi:MAG TPA: YceI family protein [Gammaproteobacteria bacterium]|nr:YceI family protein [Gammaproteobacteria bacterium]